MPVWGVGISKTGDTFTGAMSFPYSIGDVEVSGSLSTDELSCRGSFNSSLTFSVNASGNCKLQLTISTKYGIDINGFLSLPAGIGDVGVMGLIKKKAQDLD